MATTAESSVERTEQPLEGEQAKPDTTPQAKPKAKPAAKSGAKKATPAKANGKSSSTKAESKPSRPEPVKFGALKEGAKVKAYHPRLHPKQDAATVARDLAVADTYVAVKFSKTGDVILTHRNNVVPA